MDWIFELVSELALWGSLALLAWGAALCLEEALSPGGPQAGRAGAGAPGPRRRTPGDIDLTAPGGANVWVPAKEDAMIDGE